MEWVDIDYELRDLDTDNFNWEFFDGLSDQVIKNIAKKYQLGYKDPRIQDIINDWPGPLLRKQRYLIIFSASECEKELWK